MPRSSSSTYQSISQLDSPRDEKLPIITADNNYHDDDFQWTQQEEAQVISIIDKYLMIFILLMTFVLNMDRTNICKYKLHKLHPLL